MCAMIPMFRTLSMATGRSCIFSATFISLVPEVRESFVAFGHPVGLLFALDLEEWRGVAKRLVEDLQRLLLGLLRCTRQRVVDDLLRGRALALAHDHVHELGDRLRLVYGVRRDDTFDGTVATRHQAAALPFSRF